MGNVGVEGNVIAFRERLRAPLKLHDYLPSYHYAVVAARMICQMRTSVAARFNDQLSHLEIWVIEMHQVFASAHRVLDHAAIGAAHYGRASFALIELIIEQHAWTNHECVGDRHQRDERRARLSALNLAQQARTDLRCCRDRPQRQPALQPESSDAPA